MPRFIRNIAKKVGRATKDAAKGAGRAAVKDIKDSFSEEIKEEGIYRGSWILRAENPFEGHLYMMFDEEGNLVHTQNPFKALAFVEKESANLFLKFCGSSIKNKLGEAGNLEWSSFRFIPRQTSESS